MASLQGQLLLASARLTDPNFARTVILIVQHDENGALGLVLNRPLETTLKQVCEDTLEVACAIDAPLHLGGPCEGGPLMVLHRRELDAQLNVTDGVYFTTDRAQIESLLLDAETTVKCFVNYAGWSPGQLENEIEVGSWLALEATGEQIFDHPGGPEQWEQLMQRITLGKWIDPKRIPDDPNVN